MPCSRRLQNPMLVGDFAKTSVCVMRRYLKFEARVGDKLASWSVVRNRARRCSGTSESAASGPESGTSGGTDVGRNEDSSKQQQQQQYLFARMAGNQKEQLPIKAGSLQRKHKLNKY